MRAIVRGIVVGTLGLAVLFASPAVRSAERPPIPIVTYCGCTCWYSGVGGKTQSKGVTFTTDRSCGMNGRGCFCDGQTCYLEYKTGTLYKGALLDCKNVPPMKQSEPPASVSPPVQGKPPAGQSPAAR